MLQYQRFLPLPALRSFIQCYWEVKAGANSQELDLVSDGHPELVFLNQPGIHMRVGKQASQTLPLAGLIGQLSVRSFTNFPSHHRIIYAKLYPWTPYLLFQVPCNLLRDSITDLEVLSKQVSYRQLASDIRSMELMSDIVDRLNHFFLEKLAHLKPDSPFVQFAVQQIFRTKGTITVDALTDNIQASRRYVEKTFNKHIGMTPKRYARLIRIKKASLLMLEGYERGNIGRVANALNYYDSSHFLKDFKSVAGRTPSEFLKQQGNLPLDQVEVYLRQWDY